MSSPVDEDQEQRNTSMENSKAMTIDFLRARLLSERSVSKTARQRADELSKRVSELEEQLKFVSLQRKKAERATADVLAILENHGVSDVSEGFDSNSDQGETLREVKTDTFIVKEISSNFKSRKNEREAYSSSELESSPSTGGSLSWKSTKDSLYSLDKKLYMDSVRRRASFALNGSSARRAGKSCRRIRRRDSRAIEELQNDSPVKTSCSRDVSNCPDGKPAAFGENTKHDDEKNPVESQMFESESESQKINGHCMSEHERDEDMESALQHQAQLICQYEEEEKAQREWEEKFRENNSGTQDSCDPGNHSDVTEERDEIKLPEVSDAAGTLCLDNQEMKEKLLDTSFCEQLQISKSLPSLPDAKKGFLQDQRCSDTIESPASEFSFPMSKEKSNQENSRKHHEASVLSCQRLPVSCAITHTSAYNFSHVEKTLPSFVSPSNSSSYKFAAAPQEASNDLGSVLEALQQAKLSLKQKLNSLPLAAEGTSNTSDIPSNTSDTFKFPTSSPALFRLPTDNQYGTTTIAEHSYFYAKSSLANFSPEMSGDKFFSEPYNEPRNALSRDMFLTVPSSPFTEIRPGVHQRSLSQPRLGIGAPPYGRLNHIDSYPNAVLPFVKENYPFLPDITHRMPLNEGTSRLISSSETGVPPVTHLPLPDDHYRPHMNRLPPALAGPVLLTYC